MITLKLSPDTRWNEVSTHLGTIYHGISGYGKHGVAAAIHQDYQSTLATRRYMCGLEQPNYPMPAIHYKHTWYVDNNGLCHAVEIGKRWFKRQ